MHPKHIRLQLQSRRKTGRHEQYNTIYRISRQTLDAAYILTYLLTLYEFATSIRYEYLTHASYLTELLNPYDPARTLPWYSSANLH